MQKPTTRLLSLGLLASTLLGSGCAASYTPIHPEHIATYQSSPTGAPLQFGYQYDALRLRGRNKKYAKKELKHNYHVVAVRVTNTTASDINFSRDAVLYCGDHPVQPVTAQIAAQDMKQGVWIYLLYIPLNLTIGGTTTTNGYGQTTTTGGTSLPTGPLIAGGNILGASLANANFRRDLENNNLINRNIRPGETVYGLISLREPTVAPLRLELRTVASTTPASAPAMAPAAAPVLPPASSPIPGGSGN
jgi:hypothetical protein